MGTNFYTVLGKHIGKRSAAGWYCWNCRVTLCKGGDKDIHMTDPSKDWYESCPKCGALIHRGSMFSATNPVRPCSSFTWAISPDNVRSYLLSEIVRDEYNRAFTLNEFLKDIDDTCPIQYYHLMGEEFE